MWRGIIGMTLPVAVLAAAAGALAAIVMCFFSLAVGWGVAVALALLYFAVSGYKLMAMQTQRGDDVAFLRSNSVAAGNIAVAMPVAGVLWALWSGATSGVSAWWACLLPLVVPAHIMLMICLNTLLDLIAPRSRG